jgi:hypothetical protein
LPLLLFEALLRRECSTGNISKFKRNIIIIYFRNLNNIKIYKKLYIIFTYLFHDTNALVLRKNVFLLRSINAIVIHIFYYIFYNNIL